MIPEFLTEATNANILVFTLSENMNSYRARTVGVLVPRWLSRWLAALPNWILALNMLTVGQVAYLFILPALRRQRAATDKRLNIFRRIDISRYNDEGKDQLCKMLEESCDWMDKVIHEREKLQLHRVLALRREHKRHLLAKQELEDILETWILARNSEFKKIFGSILDEFEKYIETVNVSTKNPE